MFRVNHCAETWLRITTADGSEQAEKSANITMTYTHKKKREKKKKTAHMFSHLISRHDPPQTLYSLNARF